MQTPQRFSLWCFAVVLGWGLCVHSTIVRAQSNEPNEQELQQIQNQIKRRQEQLQEQMLSAQDLQNRLKAAELEISRLSQDIVVSERMIKDNQKEQNTLIKEKNALLKKKEEQQALLAKQIRSAYMRGNHDYTKMLLNQEDAGKFERMLVYYQYLNNARQSEIESFQSLVTQLLDVATKLKANADQLKRDKANLEQQQVVMRLRQQERESTLQALQKTINNEAAHIEQLQINEQNLVQAMEAARKSQEMADQELLGLEPFKGKLLQPADGRLRKLFGKRRQGQVHWKGVLVYGDAGSPISAIHHGKVLFADWLRGFGLMIIVDHGNGYMSLYGQNQALLKQVGDRVEAGETIALLGQSGGQSRPSLYFEIRHKGQPVNPANWLQK
ncbi:peptidoglycan DD-metalloendopeptidase family protein [Paraneptunicella aestuarii]|uniref:murein hydrolase activator EnvC family protein n=1 Tax=Paraneptunicella aestuarii TaxID=2831148 RepID=UPI001E4D6D1F|nr:peptidoglycan DD-metalloendopeptidase family protein [Paraneptunicella aestuarii]UAA38756.1 peptidoglycan DD-metalloendopeptidase family protein [Paraneptunicella aestuarii]